MNQCRNCGEVVDRMADHCPKCNANYPGVTEEEIYTMVAEGTAEIINTPTGSLIRFNPFQEIEEPEPPPEPQKESSGFGTLLFVCTIIVMSVLFIHHFVVMDDPSACFISTLWM